MKLFPLTILCLPVLFQLVLSLSPTYLACQRQKSAGESALVGCPKGTLYVSRTDSSANFSSVQEAINSLPRVGKHAFILIGEGQYFEMINVTRTAPLTLLGQLSPTTSTQAGSASERNLVQIWNSQYVHDGVTDEETATLTVAPTLGHPFGCEDFRAYNIDFENRAANYSIAQALVTSITLANASLYGCTFSSFQDTWYTGYGANTYVVDSIIYGQTDYIFGCGTAFFESVTLANRGCGGAITAWEGEFGTTRGVYIANSSIIRSPDAAVTSATDESCFLGRAWNEYARVVYLYNYMDRSVHPSGFTSWYTDGSIPSTTFYAEFGSYGPGGDMSNRVKQEHVLDQEQAKTYTFEYVFNDHPRWIDTKYRY